METGITNMAVVCGEVLTEPRYSHAERRQGSLWSSMDASERYDVYSMKIINRRKSGYMDVVRVLFPADMADRQALTLDTPVEVRGMFCSHNMTGRNGKHRVDLFVRAEEIRILDETESTNTIRLDGFICKEPRYKETPSGRQLTSMILAVNRPKAEGKTDYIPCVFWGRSAEYVRESVIGSEIACEGRIESRNYEKNGETFTSYEVSVAHFDTKFIPLERGM